MARWLPLESNPTVMNKFLAEMGVPGDWSAVDVYGLDADLLAIVPQPVVAVILLYPLTEKAVEFRIQQKEAVKAAGQDVSDKVFFMRQYVGNACGTVALIHSLTNSLDQIVLEDGILKSFIEKCKGMNPEGKGNAFKDDDDIANIHDKLAKEGQSAAPAPEARVEPHFISLVKIDGSLYELDGTKEFPINHGSTNDDNFLQDATNICRNFMKQDPDESRFAIIAIAASQDV